MSRPTPALIGAIVLAAFLGTPATADFNGEVLIAPPPPNWAGGIEEPQETGVRRVWQRPNPDETGSIETISVTRLTGMTESTAAAVALQAARAALGRCDKPTASDPLPEPAAIGVTASVTATCAMDGGVGAFVVGHALVGDFNTYTVVRAWRGDPRDPSNPANSPRAAEAWQRFFTRLGVCNTLTSACDAESVTSVHAHPRYGGRR